MTNKKNKIFPKTRIATIDVCSIGLSKHHIPALIEIDVTISRIKIKEYKKHKARISFTAWLIKVISNTIKEYEDVAAYLKKNRKLSVFSDINISIAVEKEINGQKVPIPLLIEKTNKKSIETITEQINNASIQSVNEKDIVLQKRTSQVERLYFNLPGFLRRLFWKLLLKHPNYAFNKMGNVSVTSLGMIGKANGWFIPISIHPICFGIGKVTKKPVVINDKIEIREILNLTVLLDHDIVDGAIMARFISSLTKNLQDGQGL